MAGWAVMAAPLELLVRIVAPLSCVVGLRWQTVVATAVVGVAVLLVVGRPGARTSP